MESLFRRFLSPRRVEPQFNQSEAQSVVYQSPRSSSRLRMLLSPSLRKNWNATRKDEQEQQLRLSPNNEHVLEAYKTSPNESQKPNSTTNYRASGRFSSENLSKTKADYKSSFEDIDQNEHRVNTRRILESPREFNHNRNAVITGSTPLMIISTAPVTSKPFNGKGSPAQTNSERRHSYLSRSVPGTENSTFPDALHGSGPTAWSSSDSYKEQTVKPIEGLGIINSGLDSEPPRTPTYTLLEPFEEPNASIQALWKAEYNRLVASYGQTGVDKHITDLNREEQYGGYPKSKKLNNGNEIRWMLEALPRPSLETRYGTHIRRSSGVSHHDRQYVEDHSDESSQKRLSILSSVGGSSSYTGRTSFNEPDPTTTLEDLRKVVEQMRSTYLRAIEEKSKPGNPKTTKSMKKKRRKRSKSTPTPMIDQILSPNLQHSTIQNPHPLQPKRSVTPTTGHRRKSSTTSQCARLPVIEASPSKDDTENIDPGLKRADSTTLGVMMAPVKRDKLARRHVSQPSSSSNISPLFSSLPPSPGMESIEKNDLSDDEAVFHDFDNLLVHGPTSKLHPSIIISKD